ncbi:hypothetical protein [Solidesulfovibrio carbinolicus]|uniref:hypothetical protein n=1 Tax=Solidesulfovibrio carbinolicus TaxID=296842 RepID=UPI0010103810|nr:hypothetical protein [Solidesulfovibrio carbinolicus]
MLVRLVQDRHGSGFAAWATVASTKSAYDVPWKQAKAMSIYSSVFRVKTSGFQPGSFQLAVGFSWTQ